MSDQTHCIICNNHLRGRGIWCTTCASYMQVKCSGFNCGSDHDDKFSCIRCNSLTTDNTTTDIQVPRTQRQQAPSTNNQNPAIANSNETVTATPDPWSNPTPELKDKMKTIYSEAVHWEPVFRILALGLTFLNRTLNSLMHATRKHTQCTQQ